jgi:hypothetical protein
MPRDDAGKRFVRPPDHTNSGAQAYRPLAAEAKSVIRERKAEFESLNQFVAKHFGWIVSIPGDRIVDFQCLAESQLPNQLAALGYRVEPDGMTERILPHAIQERFCRTASGELEPLTEGSTKPVVSVRTHAGLCKVAKFWFQID